VEGREAGPSGTSRKKQVSQLVRDLRRIHSLHS
jgi:hypothetical protein